MNKRTRQYTGLLSAIVCYYGVHEGAHLLYALSVGAFKKINFLGLGIQVDVFLAKSTLSGGINCLR